MQQHLADFCFSHRYGERFSLGAMPSTLPSSDSKFREWFSASIHDSPTILHHGLATMFILTTWRIWKHRKGCVFNSDRPSIARLTDCIKEDARVWVRAGAKGLGQLIDET